ncbi:APC family permease [Cloacibacillus evryensis]|uniref:APC family permease n=1 Tax=Cloacibacillus evryensis TaxID=508460 RepID=UPI00210B5E67|nr:APC family permease [Cloacibacillus evryensis]MCQ4765137.1 APC family permease [Cloacibacillus evryensis]
MGELKREVGLIPAVATAVGIVVSSSALLMLGQGFGLGGRAFVIAMVIAALVNLFVAFSFAELTGLLPVAGGINHYTLPAMGRTVGIFAVLAGYFLVSILSNASESTIAGTVIHDYFLPDIGVGPTFWALVMMAVLTVINLFGAKSFAYSQVFLAGTMIASMVILSCIGLFELGSGQPLKTNLTWDIAAGGGILSMLSIAFWLFVGLEFVCPLAEEVKEPQRFIPIAMISGIVIIFISDILFGFMAMKYMPLDKLASSTAPHVDAATAVMGRTGQIWIGIISLVATGSTLNTFVAAIPRMLYGMAKEGQFPRVFARLNRYGAPYVGVLLVFVITVMLLAFNDPDSVAMISTYVLSGCIGWMISYIIAHVDVLILRKKYPNAPRSFKVPGGPILPILSCIGLVIMIIMIHPDPVISGQIFLFAGASLALCAVWSVCWVKFVMKKPLFETVPLEQLRAKLEVMENEEAFDEEEESVTIV